MYKKIQTCFFVSLPSIVRFSKQLCHGVLYQTENLHAFCHMNNASPDTIF